MQNQYKTVPSVLMSLTRSCMLEVSNSPLSSESVIEMCAVCTGYLDFNPRPSLRPHSTRIGRATAHPPLQCF